MICLVISGPQPIGSLRVLDTFTLGRFSSAERAEWRTKAQMEVKALQAE